MVEYFNDGNVIYSFVDVICEWVGILLSFILSWGLKSVCITDECGICSRFDKIRTFTCYSKPSTWHTWASSHTHTVSIWTPQY